MNNDGVPPKPTLPTDAAADPVVAPASSNPLAESDPLRLPQGSRKKKVLQAVVGIIAILLLIVMGVVGWYVNALQPAASGGAARVRLQVVAGSSPDEIGQLLQDQKLIKSRLAFDIYTRLAGNRDQLQAGTYSLTPSDSTGDIVSYLVSGKVDEFSITFLPGATLKDTTSTAASKKADVQTMLQKAGFSQQAIDAAFAKAYDYPGLFAGKPAGTSLEGYIYGDTYTVDGSTTAEQVIDRALAKFDQVVKTNNLKAKFKQHGLTLYQGITLASIVQREVSAADSNRPSSDQRQVAQIFYSRLAQGMPLGSDVTAYYGADKVGQQRSVAVDTPYNTRIHKGLPPGPIATPGLGALLAVASPAPGDYLYFLSGDDDKTYFARTNEEHENNIREHCKIKCAVN